MHKMDQTLLFARIAVHKGEVGHIGECGSEMCNV